MITPMTARTHKQPRIQPGPWRSPPPDHTSLAPMRDLSFLRLSLKSLQHHLILAKKVKTIRDAPQIGKTTNNHDHSRHIEFELLKSQFLATISHELRTPLHVISGYLSLLLDGARGNIGEEACYCLTKAMDASRHMLKLVDDLLDLACFSAGVMEIRREAIDLKGFLNGLAQEWEASIRDRSLVLHKRISPSLPKIETDKNRLEKVLNNLLDNAVKFTPQGKIVLSACSRRDAVEIAVADTGIGISRECQQIIFDAFRQVDASETRAYQGMGLGLALSEKLVRLLGGRIEIESEVGKGSAFRIILPREIQHASKSPDR